MRCCEVVKELSRHESIDLILLKAQIRAGRNNEVKKFLSDDERERIARHFAEQNQPVAARYFKRK